METKRKKKDAWYRVSYSKITKWQTCKYAFHLRYIEKLRRKRKSKALQVGSLIHIMIDADANGDDPILALDKAIKKASGPMFASERDEFREMVDDVRDIMTDYFATDWGDKAIRYTRKGGKSAEHEFEVELAPGIMITGKLDGLGHTPDKRRWLVENKSFSRMPNEDHRWRNLQGNIYHHVIDLLSLPKLAGLCWNYIRTKPPTVPKIMKDGSPSQKRLDTLPTRLRNFFDEHDFNPKKSALMFKTAEANTKNYFIRVFSPLRPRVVKRIVADFVAEANIMAEYEGRWKTKTIGRHCEWCEYEALCRAELTDADTDFVRKKEYYPKDDEDAPIQIGD